MSNPIAKFYNTTESRNFVERICKEFELCPKYCHLQTNVSSCFHYQIKECKGVCRGEEPIESYNKRVKEAIKSIRYQTENFIIKEKGRNKNEYAYVLVYNGIYQGFGYQKKNIKLAKTEDYLTTLNAQKDNRDVQRILRYYLTNNEINMQSVNEFSNSYSLF